MAEPFIAPRPGTAFEEQRGKLLLFERDAISVMVGWPEPGAWTKTRDHPVWRRYRPDIRLPANDLDGRIATLSLALDEGGQLLLGPCFVRPLGLAHRRELLWLRWCATIPEESRSVIAPFPSRHWHLLSFVARCGPAAMDLVLTNPALAYALASNWVYHVPRVRQPLRSARALLKSGKKQRDILAWLGFPATEAARRVLAKVVRRSISITGLLYLRQSMAFPRIMKILSHLPRINTGAIRIATDPELLPLATPSLLAEIALSRIEDRSPEASHLLRDSLEMLRAVRGPAPRFPPLRGLGDLFALHETLILEMTRIERSAGPLQVFPPPPVPGTEKIIPITTSDELLEEGRIQKNCVGSYAARIAMRRQLYVYRVLLAQRCTLSLARAGNRWVLAELAQAGNAKPSRETRQAVEKWLAAASPRPKAEVVGLDGPRLRLTASVP